MAICVKGGGKVSLFLHLKINKLVACLLRPTHRTSLSFFWHGAVVKLDGDVVRLDCASLAAPLTAGTG